MAEHVSQCARKVKRLEVAVRDVRCYVVENGDHDTAFKKFDKEQMALLPCSSNPDHKPIPLGSHPFRVIGRVVFFGADL
jgi:phage repressor protein C with HTH and peptisase S24 domain